MTGREDSDESVMIPDDPVPRQVSDDPVDAAGPGTPGPTGDDDDDGDDDERIDLDELP